MFTDTHCHLFNEYYDSIEKVIELSKKKNVVRFINSGCNCFSNKEVLKSTIDFVEVYASLGIHPEYAESYTKADLKFIEQNLNNQKILAVGEIGLDYHYENFNKDKQKKLFESQLSLASKYKIPVIIHSRNATEDTINILKKYSVTGVIHSFSGSLEVANIYIKMGFKLGINGVVTFKNSNLKNVIEKLSLQNILLETDSPYLTPHPYRGLQNNPSYILNIAEYICSIKNISIENLANIMEENFQDLFLKNKKAK